MCQIRKITAYQAFNTIFFLCWIKFFFSSGRKDCIEKSFLIGWFSSLVEEQDEEKQRGPNNKKEENNKDGGGVIKMNEGWGT